MDGSITQAERAVYNIRSPLFRDCFTWSIAAFVDIPLMAIGHLRRH